MPTPVYCYHPVTELVGPLARGTARWLHFEMRHRTVTYDIVYLILHRVRTRYCLKSHYSEGV